MAVLYAILDLLLNFQHCFYNFWRKPRQKRKQQQQQALRSAALAPTQEQQATNNKPADDQAPQSDSSNPDNGHRQNIAFEQSDSLQKGSANTVGNRDAAAAEGAAPVQSILNSFEVSNPGAHHLRALSAGDLSDRAV